MTDRKLIDQILVPVADYAISHGLRLQDLTSALKESLIESAIRSLDLNSQGQTASAISIMTGVHRKDVAESLRGARPGKAKGMSIPSRVVSLWRTDKRFSSSNNLPRTLSIDGTTNSFASLVAEVTKELTPKLILDELLRTDCVRVNRNNVSLLTTAYIPKKNLSEAGEMLKNDLSDLLTAFLENVETEYEVSNLHLKTEYDSIPDEYVNMLKSWCLEEGTKFHLKLQQKICMYDKDINPRMKDKAGRNRIAIGSFSACSKKN